MTLDRRRLARLEAQSAPHPAVRPAAPSLRVPHALEFTMSADFLSQALFPRQATLLKLFFCLPELLTPFDEQVIAEWASGFTVQYGNDGTAAYHGSYGVPPDVRERMQWCLDHGRQWFREVIFVGGRRGSKSWLGATAASYVIWRLLALGDPARYFGIAAGKQLQVPVFAGQRDQARANQFADVSNLITSAPCFRPYVAKESAGSLWLYSPAQLEAGGVPPNRAALVISAKEATPLAGRGPATPLQLFDEMAHMAATGANRSAQEVFSASHPALAQFATTSFLYEASSPWTQQGQFHTNYQNGLAVDPDTGLTLGRDTLVVQLPSFDLYRDWIKTRDPQFLAWPDGSPFVPLAGPVLDDSAEAPLRRADPDRYGVEFLAQWATSLSAYLPAEHVDGLFARWRGQPLRMQTQGTLEHSYVAHADPSRSGANFALVIAHPELDERGVRHVVVDLVKVWRPKDFDRGRVNYEIITEQLEGLLMRFPISQLSLDQFNSAGLLDRLEAFVSNNDRVLGSPTIIERTATAPANQRMAETTKTALSRRLVHAPYHDLLDAELRNLEVRNGRVAHPTRGPVQTDDTVDALMNVVDHLLSDHNGYSTMQAIGDTTVTGSQPPSVSAKLGAVHHRRSSQGMPRGYSPGPARGGRYRRGGRY